MSSENLQSVGGARVGGNRFGLVKPLGWGGRGEVWPPVAQKESSSSTWAAAADESGFVSLFNGRDLTGWEGDTNYWSVKDGAIIGRVSQSDADLSESCLC